MISLRRKVEGTSKIVKGEILELNVSRTADALMEKESPKWKKKREFWEAVYLFPRGEDFGGLMGVGG